MSPTNTTCFSVGDKARLTFTVLSTGGAGVDTTVTVLIQPPTGTVVRGVATSTGGSTWITRDSAGHWHADYLTTVPGRHPYTFRSTGTIQATTSGAFTVRSLEASS